MELPEVKLVFLDCRFAGREARPNVRFCRHASHRGGTVTPETCTSCPFRADGEQVGLIQGAELHHWQHQQRLEWERQMQQRLASGHHPCGGCGKKKPNAD